MAASMEEVMNSSFHGLTELMSKLDEKLDVKFTKMIETLRLLAGGEDDPIAELKQLQETDGIMAYHCKFEVIRNRVQLPESYLVSAYLAGLRNDTQMNVRMFHPHTIRQCLMLAKLYEAAHPRMGITNVNSEFNNSPPLIPMVNDSVELAEEKPIELSPKVVEDEVRVEMMSLEEVEEEKVVEKSPMKVEEETVMVQSEFGVEDESTIQMENKVVQSVAEKSCTNTVEDEEADLMAIQNTTFPKSVFHAATRSHIFCPQGVCQIAPKVSDEVWCLETLPWPPDVREWLIMIAKLHKRAHTAAGNTLQVSAKIENFELSFQNISFTTDLMVILLGNCDMGIKPGSMRETMAKQLSKLISQNVQLVMICVSSSDVSGDSHDQTYMATHQISHKDIEAVLHEFDDVFVEPTELPPFRGEHDHRIPLLEWRHYLFAGPFTIKTDQRSFKYLQEQRLNSHVQQQWLRNLLEFDYEIQISQTLKGLCTYVWKYIAHYGILDTRVTGIWLCIQTHCKDVLVVKPPAKPPDNDIEVLYFMHIGIAAFDQASVLAKDEHLKLVKRADWIWQINLASPNLTWMRFLLGIPNVSYIGHTAQKVPILVKLQVSQQRSVSLRIIQKLAPTYCGPFKVLGRCGSVAYKLELLPSSRYHLIFILFYSLPRPPEVPIVEP